MERKYIKVSDWCADNAKMDYLTLLRILRKRKVNLIRIGADYFVENASLIETAITNYMVEKKVQNQALRDEAKKRAENKRKQQLLVNKIIAAGTTVPADLLSELRGIGAGSKGGAP